MAATWHPASLRLPSGHAVALMCHDLDLQAGFGTATPHWQARQPHLSEVEVGTALLAKEGAVASLARGTVRTEGWTETENTADLWESQECQGQRGAAWSALAMEHSGKSLRLEPPPPSGGSSASALLSFCL